MQFTLRSLFVVTTALAVFLGLVKWQGPLAGVVFLLVVGLALVAAGIRTKRRGRWIAGLVLTVLTLIVLPLMVGTCGGSRECWNGYGTFPVPIEVRDADTGEPIPNAAVRLAESPAASRAVLTDSHGAASAPARFLAGGEHCWFEKKDDLYIGLGLHVLEVNAAGYEPFRRYLKDQVGVFAWDLHAPLPVVRVFLKAEESQPAQRRRRGI